MTRVILTLLLICQPFCLWTAEIPFSEPALVPAGEAARPGVVRVENPRATVALAPQAGVVEAMVARGLEALTGTPTADDAWRALVSRDEVIGIKVHSLPGPASGTRPAVAAAVIKGLLAAGQPRERIVLWDRHLKDLQRAGFVDLAKSLGVRAAGAMESGLDPDVFYENSLLGRLVYGDLEFNQPTNAAGGGESPAEGRRSFYSRLVTRELTKLINVVPLLNHNEAGVSGALYTLAAAATDNFLRFETEPALLARAVPEIYGNTNLADRVVLNVVDALIGQYEGQQRSRLNYAAALNQVWLSRDPVAVDVLALEELNRLRVRDGLTPVTNRFELYLNAGWMELGKSDLRTVEVVRLD